MCPLGQSAKKRGELKGLLAKANNAVVVLWGWQSNAVEEWRNTSVVGTLRVGKGRKEISLKKSEKWRKHEPSNAMGFAVSLCVVFELIWSQLGR